MNVKLNTKNSDHEGSPLNQNDGEKNENNQKLLKMFIHSKPLESYKDNKLILSKNWRIARKVKILVGYYFYLVNLRLSRLKD